MYYACFYIVSAYLTKKEVKATTHSGLKAAFNKELVKTGKISKEEGKLFNKLFGIRQEADYEDFFIVEEEDVAPLLPKIEKLIAEIEAIITREQQHTTHPPDNLSNLSRARPTTTPPPSPRHFPLPENNREFAFARAAIC